MKWIPMWISVLLFIGLALLIQLPLIETYDVKWLKFINQFRTPFIDNMMMLLTEIGSIKFLLPVTIIVIILSSFNKYFMEALFMLLTFWGVRMLNELLKEIIARERPALFLIEVSGYSFPSGHVMNSVAVFGFIYFIMIHVFSIVINRTQIIILLTIIVFIISVSRMYLGVHYLTDVLAGGCAGYAFLFVMIWLYQRSR